jgi:DNA polymerase III sliding clamp (beta) subunit (PCNA family)
MTDDAILLKTTTVRAKVKINTEDFMLKDMFEKLEIDKKKPIKLKNPKEFRSALNLCRFSTSQSAHDIALFCVYCTPSMVASTDNYRVSIYEIEESFNPFLIPVTTVNELLKYDIHSIHVGDNWVYFFGDADVVFVSRLIDQEFKDVRSATEGLEVLSEVEMPDDIVEVLQYLSTMADEENKIVFFSMNKEEGLLAKTEKSNGWLQKKIEVEYDGEPLSFHINMSFLLRIFSRLKTMKICEDRIIFEMGKFTHVIATHTKDED